MNVGKKSSALLTCLCAMLLTVLALPAWALGLGQMRVLSQPGQPLLAEIPIISSDPSELENLQAHLASPDTFRRVGLEPPTGEVTGLQFMVALDARGNPVIRVTSAQPIRQPLLTFLLEVDWGEGRLVREYSALVDVPRTAAAPVQPLQAPTVAPSNVIVPAPQPQPEATVAAAAGETAKPQPAPAPTAETAAPPPAPPATAIAPTPMPAPAAAAPPPPSAGELLSSGGRYRVRGGDTLSQIAASMDRSGHTLAQTMLALLRANPDAFISDNINLVKRGAVLRMPPAAEMSRYSVSEAAALVHTQIVQWRQMRAPQRQPDAVAQATAAGGNATAAASATAAGEAGGARLEIVPPAPGQAGDAGTRSGIDAGGEGDMVRQELQQTKETLAARDAEIQDLKARVAELEKLQHDQQQLIAMKDSALASAQQNLAKSNAQAGSEQPATPAAATGNGWWLWGGLGLLVLALLAWLLLRNRRRDPAPAPRRFYGDLASAVPVSGPAPDSGVDGEDAAAGDGDSAEDDDDADAGVGMPENLADAGVDPDPHPASGPAHRDSGRVPDWTANPAQVGTVPTWHGGEGDPSQSVDDQAEGSDTPARRLELAQAYLDLGDDEAARALLLEVLDGRDPSARETAARMLREL